jgi:hypothetical protein
MRRPFVLATLALAGCMAPGDPLPEPLPIPFVVSDHYSPDGFWGDGETRGALEVQRTCTPPAGAVGDCYAISYTPGARRFAGINWQYPHNNWGFHPGHQIADGATRITFTARGSAGGEVVSFSAGQTATNNPYNDSFSLGAQKATLTTDWASFSVPLRGERYDGPAGVIGAFVVSLTAPADGRAVLFQLTDLRWQP